MTTYYVDGSSGNDSTGDGSEATPWKTIEKIRATAGVNAAGNTIRYKRGIEYPPPSSRITFAGGSVHEDYGTGAKPVLRGVDVVTTWTVDSGAIYTAANSNGDKLQVGTFNAATGVDTATEIITHAAVSNSGNLKNGDSVVYSDGGGTAPTGMTDGTAYFVERLSSTTVKLHNDRDLSSSPVDISVAGVGAAHTLTKSMAMLWENGTKAYQQMTEAAVTEAGDYFFNDAGNTIHYWATDGADPDTHTILFADNRSGWKYNFTGNNGTLRNLDIAYGHNPLGLIVPTAGLLTGWVFEGCIIRDARNHGFATSGMSSGSDLTFTDCEFADNLFTGLLATTGLVNTTLLRCTFHDNEFNGCQIEGAGAAAGIVIDTCTFHTNDRDGLVIDTEAAAAAAATLVVDCTGYGNGITQNDVGAFSTFEDGTIFRRCLAYENGLLNGGTLGFGINADSVGSANVTIEYCIAYGNQSSGMGFGSNGGKIYNSVMYNNGATGGVNPVNFVAYSGTTENLEVKNCIFMNSHVLQSNAKQINDGANSFGSAGVDFDNNLYYDDQTHDQILGWDGSTYATLAAFNTAKTPQEDNGIQGDPIFVDAANGDFHLRSTSPAIDQGVDVGLSTDFDGNNISATPDIGAFEYGGDKPMISSGVTFSVSGTISVVPSSDFDYG